MKMKETYTEWLEKKSSDLAYEAGSLRGLLDIALIAMKHSGDPYTEDEYRYLTEKLKELDKGKD